MAASAELRQAAQYLRNAAPQQFDEFRAVFAAYEANLMTALVNATVNVERVQGQVQVCRDLSQMFKEVR